MITSNWFKRLETKGLFFAFFEPRSKLLYLVLFRKLFIEFAIY